MKLGLICNNEIREDLSNRIQSLGIELFASADLFIVQKGLESNFSTCIVFSKDDISNLLKVLSEFSPIATNDNISKIVGVKDEQYHIIDFDDILFFESKDSFVYCNTAYDEFRIKDKLYIIEKNLAKEKFIRINKSFIVHINNISKIIPWFNRRLLLQFKNSKKEVEVSKNYVTNFKTFLGIK